MISDSTDIFSLNYMRRLRFWIASITGWPYKVFSARKASQISFVYRCVLFAAVFIDVICGTAYWKKHTNSDLSALYVNIMFEAVYFHRLFLPFQDKYCLVIKKFILEFHLIYHKHKTDFALQVYNRINKICSVIHSVSQWQTISIIIMCNVIPFYNNYAAGLFDKNKPENATFQHSVDLELPLNQYTSYFDYFIVFLYCWYATYNICVGIFMFDVFLFTIVLHIWGHLNILIYNLKSLSGYFEQNNGIYRQEDLYKELKEIIKYHQKIKLFMLNTSEAFSSWLFCYFLFNQLSQCVMLLKCSSMDPTTLGIYGPVTLIVFQQLIETSVIFELIRLKGDKLADQVYELPWEKMDLQNRRMFLMLLFNVQKSLAIKAGGMMPVGVITMATILRNSCSYYMLLRTFT